MERKILVVGDPPICGGHVLPYQGSLSSTIHGHPVALIGGRAYCEGCHSVGIIAKAGGPRRIGFISEVALEGDVVICRCSKPQPLMSVLQSTSTCDDMWPAGLDAAPTDLMNLPFVRDADEHVAMQKLVDSDVNHPAQAQQTENICPNMTNAEFCTLVMDLRGRAVELIEVRLNDLQTWGKPEQQRVARWLGASGEQERQYLRTGLKACIRVLKALTCDNFVRYSEQLMRNVGCTPSGNKRGLAAEVCGPDVKTHTIGIAIVFCEIPRISYSIDSQLSTIIHEVTHFDDTFSSLDTVYHMRQSLALASRPAQARMNADSITGYVLYGD